MAKIVVKPAKRSAARSAGSKSANVEQKRVSGPNGSRTIFTLDTSSKTFGDDFTFVFEKNVAKARRENKRILGVPDRVPAKA